MAKKHKIFVFQKDLEGSLQNKVTKKDSKPLKALEVVMEQIRNNKLSGEFYDLGAFLKEHVTS